MTVPRRLRPTAAQRARTILTQTRGAHSGQGAAAAARPVTATRLNRQYIPPVTPNPTDRLKVNWISNAPNITTDLTGTDLTIPSWPSTFDSAGTSVTLNPGGDDGVIYLNAPGVYACNLIMQIGGNDGAGGKIRFSAQIFSGDFDIFDVGFRDGDYVSPNGFSGSTSRTFYHPGGGVSGGGIGFKLAYSGVDNAWGLVWLEVLVQRIS